MGDKLENGRWRLFIYVYNYMSSLYQVQPPRVYEGVVQLVCLVEPEEGYGQVKASLSSVFEWLERRTAGWVVSQLACLGLEGV